MTNNLFSKKALLTFVGCSMASFYSFATNGLVKKEVAANKEVESTKIVGEWVIDNTKSVGIDGEKIKDKHSYVFCEDNTYFYSCDGGVLTGDFKINGNSIEMTLPSKTAKGEPAKFIKIYSNVTNDKIEWYYFTSGKKVTETYNKKASKVSSSLSVR
ncbi:MAG: hypothetical protein J0M08_08590 [Bacteroidetes bacterium]|nr:hypothetical protein [Bacteroidota bacterium]